MTTTTPNSITTSNYYIPASFDEEGTDAEEQRHTTNNAQHGQTMSQSSAATSNSASSSPSPDFASKSDGGKLCGLRRFRIYSWLVSIFFLNFVVSGFFFIASLINFDNLIEPLEFYPRQKWPGEQWRQCSTKFYFSKEKCLPSANISYPLLPPSQHTRAGGTGTLDDPITFGAAPQIFPVGTIVYLPRLRKYFIHEDTCETCSSIFLESDGRQCVASMWIGPDYALSSENLVACSNGLAANDETFVYGEIPPGLPVNNQPLYDAQTNKCIIDNYPTCKQKSVTECGTSFGNCSIPYAASCSSLAIDANLTLSRFSQLNPQAQCFSSPQAPNTNLPSGTLICLGGPCGD